MRKRFAFVDGLSGLFLSKYQKPSSARGAENVLTNPGLASISKEIQLAIQALRDAQGAGKILLVIDQLDLVLATGGEQIGPVNVGEMLMGLREVCTTQQIIAFSTAKLRIRTCMQRLCLCRQTIPWYQLIRHL